MKTVTTILALLGAIWAFVGIAGLFLTFDSLRYVESAADLFKFLITLILFISGYFVWWGWLFFSFKERFPYVTTQAFWSISLAHHICCVLYLIPVDVWGGGDDPWWIPVWIIANIMIAVYMLAKKPLTKTLIEANTYDETQ